jgi:hypothetical protein
MIKCAYKNLLETGTVSLAAGTEDPDYPLYRLYDRDSALIFRATAAETLEVKVDQGSSPASADRLLVPAGHNLDGALLNVLYSDNDADYRSALDESLVGHFRMEEANWSGAPGEVKDSSGLANHGTAINGLDTVAGGKLGRCGDFTPASSHHIEVPHSSSICPSDAITVGAWVYRDDTGLSDRYALKKDGSYILDIARPFADKVHFFIKVDGAYRQAISSGPIPNTGWKFVVGSYSSTTGKLRLYIDGALDYEDELSGLASYAIEADQNQSLYIGAANGSSGFFDGKLDEVFVFDRELSAQEIADIYNAGAGKIVEAGQWEQSGSGIINRSWSPAAHRYWKFRVSSPQAAPEIAEMFLTSTYEWERNPARPAGPFEPVFNVEEARTSSGQERYLVHGPPRRRRTYRMPRCGEAQRTNMEALFSGWGGSAPFWLEDHEGTWLYGGLRAPIALREVAYRSYSFEFDFAEVLP